MVKIVKKKKKKKLNLETLVKRVFTFSVIAVFISATILKSYNVNLARVESNQERQIDGLKNEVANLELKVKELDDRERILEIAKKHGLKINQDKIVSVK